MIGPDDRRRETNCVPTNGRRRVAALAECAPLDALTRIVDVTEHFTDTATLLLDRSTLEAMDYYCDSNGLLYAAPRGALSEPAAEALGLDLIPPGDKWLYNGEFAHNWINDTR